jgi:aminopeptidase
VHGLRLEFKGGRVVSIEAEAGGDAVRACIGKDEGAARLGEVALVDRDSRIGKTGRVFYDTLLDENAASHLALGNAYHAGVGDADRHRINRSSIHVDFMIGSESVDVAGITAGGSEFSVLVGGAWQF